MLKDFGDRENSRVRDLADLMLMIDAGLLSAMRLATVVPKPAKSSALGRVTVSVASSSCARGETSSLIAPNRRPASSTSTATRHVRCPPSSSVI
jgi:hypothetical protein